jgi:hypothetical protein
MAECFVDADPLCVDPGLKTWGDLLATLEHTLEGEGRLVTAVRFDGVDQPSFREASAAARPLTAVDVVEVGTSTERELLQDTVDAAREGIAALIGASLDIADRLRAGDVAGGNEQLREFFDAVRTLTALTAAVADTNGVSLDALRCEGGSGVDVMNGVATMLGRMLTAQQDADWVATADCLQHEPAPAIGQWRTVFDALEGELS